MATSMSLLSSWTPGTPCRRIVAPLVVLLLALAATHAAPASASLTVVRPGGWEPTTFYGHGGFSTDGVGPADGGSLSADVPAGSTVRRAYLYGSYQGFPSGQSDLTLAQRTVSFGGASVVLAQISKTDTATDTFYTGRADVTAAVAATVGSGGSITNFATSGPTSRLHGLALAVIYENASSPLVSVALLDGFAAQTGDTATLAFASPLDKTVTGYHATLALGIGWSAQSGNGNHICQGPQASTVTVNGQRLASCAGGADDSPGSLITVGGVGDSTANPVDPFSTSSGTDDELYDLGSFTNQGDATLTIATANASINDNVFMAVVEVTAQASAAANGETPPPAPTPPTPTPLTSTGVGTTPQQQTATVPLGGSAHLLDGSTPVTSLAVPGEGSYAIDPNSGVITFTAELGFSGTATPVPYRVTNPIDESGDSIYTPTVTTPPIATPPAKTSTGVGTAPEDIGLTAPPSGQVHLMDGATPTTTVTVPGEGTYVLDLGTGHVTFTPVLGFSGTATPITYRVTDAYGQHATNTITPTVTAPPIAAPPNKISTGAGTEPQVRQLTIPTGGAIALLGPGGVPATTVTVPGEGTYTLDPTTGEVTFVAALGYVGTATAVTYRITDAYGQTADATYTPTVTIPPAPEPPAKTSTGESGGGQSQKVTIPAGGSVTLLDDAGHPTTRLEIAGAGVYELDAATGVIRFTARAGFVGTPRAVTYRVFDAYGQFADATYGPTVTPTLPATGTPTPAPALASCVSRRTITIHWIVPSRSAVRRFAITRNGAPYKRLGPTVREARIDMRGMPRRSVRVVVAGVLAGGGRITATRTYRTCRNRLEHPPLPTLRLR